MVVYFVYGFRWPRIGPNRAPGICAHIVSYNLLDANTEYLQEPVTEKTVLQSFRRIDPNIPYHLPDLQIIEPYDPDNLGDSALSQPYAYVCAKVFKIGDTSQPVGSRVLSLDAQEAMNQGSGLSTGASEAFVRLRDFLAPDEKISWWLVYNGDPERAFPKSEEDSEEGEEEEEEEE
ncbi:hypothetical protein FQN57_006496 [Myotisia sp. PD_48]|nr:hypothetical protein FQN57_006496 [Myotisia sp. PD_48]